MKWNLSAPVLNGSLPAQASQIPFYHDATHQPLKSRSSYTRVLNYPKNHSQLVTLTLKKVLMVLNKKNLPNKQKPIDQKTQVWKSTTHPRIWQFIVITNLATTDSYRSIIKQSQLNNSSKSHPTYIRNITWSSTITLSIKDPNRFQRNW